MRQSTPGKAAILALTATLVVGVLPVQAAKPRPVAGPPVDHAGLLVSRFTFGPRPGEVDSVRVLGPDKWFEQQLNPERIPDTALDVRLAQYPALQMSQEERIERYPTPNQIRQFAKTGALPQNSELRTIVADQVEFYQERQKTKAGTAAIAPMPIGKPTPASVRRGQTALFDDTGSASVNMHSPAAGAPAPVVRQDKNGVQTPVTAAAAAQPEQPSFEQSIQPLPQSQIDGLLATPPNQRYAEILRMPVDQLIALRKGMRGQDVKLGDGMTPLQKEILISLAGTNRMISAEIVGSRLLTDIYSTHELQAVMTDFWLNHFNVYIKKDGQMPSLLPLYQQTVQAHALGRFEDLLVATARSPAMLLYLDNAQSAGPNSSAASTNPNNPNAKKKKDVGLNENYARELMELHTLGVGGGYTQQDVTEVAKVFTGWTTDKPADGGQFTYNDRRHEPGDKSVLGKTIHDNGEKEGEQVLHMLATSPATARFVSFEIAERFVADTPPPALVDRMAQSFLHSQGDIKAVLRTMVHSPEFFTAATAHAKLKTPLEYVVSAARVTGANVQNPQPLVQSLERLGMPLYGCQPPTGYKWDSETWLSSSALVNRLNFALLLSSNRIGGTTIVLSDLLQNGKPATRDPTDPAQKEQALETAILTTPASAQTRAAVLSQSTGDAVPQAARDFNAVPDNGKQRGTRAIVQVRSEAPVSVAPKPGAPPADRQGGVMLGLLLGSPEFQRR